MTDNALVKGIAEYLAESGVGSWREDGAYTTGQVGIFYQLVPQAPASIITLTPYAVNDAATLSTTTTALQVRVRGGSRNPTLCNSLGDAVFDLLQGAYQLSLATGIRVMQCNRQSSVPLGQDSSGFWSRSDNYYLDVHRPSTNRT